MPFYYNINYRAYEPGTKVKTFTMADYEAAAEKLEQTSKALDRTAHVSLAAPAYEARRKVSPGADLPTDLPSGSYAVRTLEVQIDPKDAPQVLRSAVLVATFDGEPTIWCPLGEFFGCGTRLRPVEDWDRSVAADGKLTARWVMPYQKSGIIAIKNLGKKGVAVRLAASLGPWKWNDRSMHFHASWRHQYPIETKAAAGTMDWNYLETTGQGVYVGDTLTAFSPSPAWYGEGDERVYVDGEKLPSHMGTGTEDYYGYAWGMARHFGSPFISMPQRDGASREDWRGYTTTSRLRLLDGVPWQRSLKFDMEIWDWAATKLAYSVGTFWYARPGAGSNRRPMPEEAARPIPELPAKFKVAGAVECEQMKIVAKVEGLAGRDANRHPRMEQRHPTLRPRQQGWRLCRAAYSGRSHGAEEDRLARHQELGLRHPAVQRQRAGRERLRCLQRHVGSQWADRVGHVRAEGRPIHPPRRGRRREPCRQGHQSLFRLGRGDAALTTSLESHSMKLTRYAGNPILSPFVGHPWEDLAVFNPAVWFDEKKHEFLLLYRAAESHRRVQVLFRPGTQHATDTTSSGFPTSRCWVRASRASTARRSRTRGSRRWASGST